jgi:hypothetical protein
MQVRLARCFSGRWCVATAACGRAATLPAEFEALVQIELDRQRRLMKEGLRCVVMRGRSCTLSMVS